MKREPEFTWTEDGNAICVLVDEKDRIHVGTAMCHPNDVDMMSEKTGCEIAYRRARIEALKAVREDTKTALAALKQLYYSMNHSKKFDPNSYENKTLQRHIRMTEFDLATIKDILATERKNLREYLQDKDLFYKRIRANRNKANSVKEN